MSPAAEPNVREVLLLAEKELAMGHFIRATRLSMKAGKLMDKVQEVHRNFVNLLRKGEAKIADYESKGYDVAEAKSVLRTAKDTALKSDYDAAMSRIRTLNKALNRATYLPFPLLNRNVDIISTAFWTGEYLSYTVKVENPSMTESLGEIIIRPDIEPGIFREVPERLYGDIQPRYWKEWTFNLIPIKPDWKMGGLDSNLFKEVGVVFKSRFSSRGGKATYSITVENNNDQIVRDIGIIPNPPGGLHADPRSVLVEFVEPFGSKTIDFILSTPRLEDRDDFEIEFDGGVEDAVIVDEADFEVAEIVKYADKVIKPRPMPDEAAWAPKVPTVEPEPIDDLDAEEEGPQNEGIESTESWDEEEVESMDRAEVSKKGARDFTPQDEDYDLMMMSAYAYPESVKGGPGRSLGAEVTGEDEELEENA